MNGRDIMRLLIAAGLAFLAAGSRPCHAEGPTTAPEEVDAAAPVADRTTARLIAAAEQLKRDGRRSPADFEPAVELKSFVTPSRLEAWELLWQRELHRPAPLILDDPAAARAAVERFVGSDPTNWWIRKDRDKGWFTNAKSDVLSRYRFFYAFETTWRRPHPINEDCRMVHVVLRPGFLAEATGPADWFGTGGEGLKLDPAVLKDVESFGRATDLLYWIMLSHSWCVFLVERKAVRESERYRWTGTLGQHVFIEPPDTRRWRFDSLTITADVKTGHVDIRADGGVDAAPAPPPATQPAEGSAKKTDPHDRPD